VKEKLEHIIGYTFVDTKYVTISLLDIAEVILILIISRILVWIIGRVVKRLIVKRQGDEGKAYAIRQIAAYFVYTIALVLILDSFGVKITVLLAGGTALFVGLGLGLQDAFKDLVAGIIILSERTVTAHDIVEIDGTVGEVLEVGLRTTTLRTRDDIELIMPNQKLTNERVINWSRNKKMTRFNVEVGVAYGSDTELVKDLLLEVASKSEAVSDSPAPHVFFDNFGNSSLNFKLFFYSHSLFRIERVKSQLRFEIDKKFRENGVTIAFPQMDIWVKQLPEQKPKA
jgi:small-conductance mechanosensitive channel